MTILMEYRFTLFGKLIISKLGKYCKMTKNGGVQNLLQYTLHVFIGAEIRFWPLAVHKRTPPGGKRDGRIFLQYLKIFILH